MPGGRVRACIIGGGLIMVVKTVLSLGRPLGCSYLIFSYWRRLMRQKHLKRRSHLVLLQRII